jgi:hypothetical protein
MHPMMCTHASTPNDLQLYLTALQSLSAALAIHQLLALLQPNNCKEAVFLNALLSVHSGALSLVMHWWSLQDEKGMIGMLHGSRLPRPHGSLRPAVSDLVRHC